MTLLDASSDGSRTNPIDRLEQIVSTNQWPFERFGDDEMAFSIGGMQAQYHLWFGWNRKMRSLELRCAIDVTVPKRRYSEMAEVLARINFELWMGHFDSNPDEPGIVFRHTLFSGGADGLQFAELEMIVDVALTSCERCYPAFMLLLWGGQKPEDAVAAAILETIGEA